MESRDKCVMEDFKNLSIRDNEIVLSVSDSDKEIWKVYMHPSNAKRLSLTAGMHVLVDGKWVFPIWPLTKMSKNECKIPFHLETKSVTIQSWNGILHDCTGCIVSVNETFISPQLEAIIEAYIRSLHCLQTNCPYALQTTLDPSGSISFTCQSLFCNCHFKNENNLHQEKKVYGKLKADVAIKIVLRAKKEKKLCPFGGFDNEMTKICAIIDDCKAGTPHSILLYGPSGSGKTAMVKHVARRVGKPLTIINSDTLRGQWQGDAEKKLKKVYSECKLEGGLLFIDNIDSFCPKRGGSYDGTQEESLRLWGTLLNLLDFSVDSSVIFIATTKNIEDIDGTLRRPGRFDIEVEIGVPRKEQKIEIISSLLSSCPNNLTDDDIIKVVDRCHGYVASDFVRLVKEANMLAFERCLELNMELEDMIKACVKVKPSAIQHISLSVPNVKWDDIGGQNETKIKLKESVELPLKHPEKFIRFGIQPPKGVLLYGPPGCSKTLLAKALATEAHLNFMAVKGPEIFSKWVGDSEKTIRDIFQKARQIAPSIIFFDEFDSIAASRDGGGNGSVGGRVISQLLLEMDGADPLLNVTVVAATNRPDIIDSALLRPGRFDRHIYVGLPDREGIRAILEIQCRKMPIKADIDCLIKLIESQGYSGAEIVAICQEAALNVLSIPDSEDVIEMVNFKIALEKIKPSTPRDLLELYEKFQHQS